MEVKLEKVLEQAIERIKSMGYSCFVPKYKNDFGKHTYCYITDGKNISYMQTDHWKSGIEFSTTHKPSKECGTGFAIEKNDITRAFDVEDITEDVIKMTFGTPKWAMKYKSIKYANWEEFCEKSLTGKICVELVEL